MSKQRVFTKFSVFLKRVSSLNPRVHTNFVAFPLERTRKSLEVRFDFGPRPGFSKQLFGSSREGSELDWTYFKHFKEIAAFFLETFDSTLLFQRQKTLRVGICDLEMQRFAISFRGFSVIFCGREFGNAAICVCDSLGG